MIALGLLTLALAADRPASVADCDKINARYKSTIAAISDALRTYEKCVSASQGRDDCSGEFGDLDLAAAGFEKMVAAYAVCQQPGTAGERR